MRRLIHRRLITLDLVLELSKLAINPSIHDHFSHAICLHVKIKLKQRENIHLLCCQPASKIIELMYIRDFDKKYLARITQQVQHYE